VTLDVPNGGSFAATGGGGEQGQPIDIGIRTDHVRIGQPSVKGLGFVGTISNIEYRGSSMKLSVDGAGVEDFTAIIDERSFFASPVAVGDAVPLSWDAGDAIVLGGTT
jgi:putative spermidine/putrescine transport system ATP-binding protein